MLVLTFAPCDLTIAPCACGVSLLSTSATTPLAHMVVVTGCNLRWWHFPSAIGTNTPCTGGCVTHYNLRWLSFSFHPLAHIRTPFAVEQLALCGGIYTCIYLYIYIYYHTPLVSTQVTPPPSSTLPPPSSLSTLSSLMYNRQQGGMDKSG